MEIIYTGILENAFWSGTAALGFGILFNIPKRLIPTVFILGFIAGFTKFYSLQNQYSIVVATFFASLLVGFLSIPFAKRVRKPIVVFSIPAIIPMIPGYFAYKTILGIRNFTLTNTLDTQQQNMLNHIFSNGFMTIFILFAITVGVSAPMLILGKDMTKKLPD